MKVSQKVSLLAVAFAMVGCNEKISPELQNGGLADSSNSSTPVAPNEYYFNVTNTSAAGLNYNLHKTGAGNSKTPCQIKNSVGFSSDLFRGANADYDITCFFEAEELAIAHQGISFAVNASQNTCDFVGYMPYSYYESIPGDSSGSLTEVKCMNDTTTTTNVGTAATALGIDLSTSTTPAGCNQWVSNDINPGTRVSFAVESDQDLCRFNYRRPNKEEMKCDIGIIQVNTLQVTYTPADGTTPAVLKYETVPRTVKCGGKVGNCTRGPVEFIAKGKPLHTEMVQQELNKPVTKEYKLPALLGVHHGTKRYANFRRDLSSLELDFVTSDGLTPAYKSSFSDPIIGKEYTPRVADLYASNKKLDGSRIISTPLLSAYSFPNNQYKAVPLAADPFIGISRPGTSEQHQVNPFYTFYCFDNALDIKARIRMVVRDWDRIFPSGTADNEYISDIFRGANSRQDNRYYVELPDDNDGWIPFNDRGDWDDFIPMERTIGSYDPTSTVWRPVPDTSFYTDGFFNPAFFVNQEDEVQ